MTEGRAAPCFEGDEELVCRARRGDRSAFATLFDRHRPTATGLVTRLLADRDDVDDVLQESAIQALVGLERLREGSRFGSWLCGIALNLARRELRHRMRRNRAPHETPSSAPLLPEEVLEEAETAAMVRRTVDTLPSGQRAAVRLFYLAGLSEAEVAAELQIPRSAVKSRLYKARRSLGVNLRQEREVVMTQSSLIDVEVIDVRRQPIADPGGGRTHVVLLRERGGGRMLPIFIGEFEGRAMASSMTGMQTPRPMTYQLAVSLVGALSGSVTEVRVVRLAETTYVAEVVLNKTTVIDARPSDAINLALLTDAPIRAATDVLDQWATSCEEMDADEYWEGPEDIRGELDSPVIGAESAERLSPTAIEVIADARRDAASRAHRAVGTEHLLLALLRRSTAEQLAMLGLSASHVEGALAGVSDTPLSGGGASFTPRVSHVLWTAGRRARSRPDSRATPDDLLAALLDERGGVAARLLDQATVDRDEVRARLAGP